VTDRSFPDALDVQVLIEECCAIPQVNFDRDTWSTVDVPVDCGDVGQSRWAKKKWLCEFLNTIMTCFCTNDVILCIMKKICCMLWYQLQSQGKNIDTETKWRPFRHRVIQLVIVETRLLISKSQFYSNSCTWDYTIWNTEVIGFFSSTLLTSGAKKEPNRTD
jgi:hypothetical protein